MVAVRWVLEQVQVQAQLLAWRGAAAVGALPDSMKLRMSFLVTRPLIPVPSSLDRYRRRAPAQSFEPAGSISCDEVLRLSPPLFCWLAQVPVSWAVLVSTTGGGGLGWQVQVAAVLVVALLRLRRRRRWSRLLGCFCYCFFLVARQFAVAASRITIEHRDHRIYFDCVAFFEPALRLTFPRPATESQHQPYQSRFQTAAHRVRRVRQPSSTTLVIVPSAMDSPICGITTSVLI